MIESLAVVIGAVLAAVGLRWVRTAPLSENRMMAPARRPDQLERVELALAMSTTAMEEHHRLRPLLRQVAARRLDVHGVALDRDADAARRALGEPLWELVRPGRPRPDDRRAPARVARELDAALERLEAL